jgi:methylenetetrahydrofolate reductase (NADPH)
MKLTDIISTAKKPGFSFEVLPPLKGRGIEQIFNNIDRLKEFNPLYINITTHRSEMVYKTTADGLSQRISERSRPGTVAVAAAIQQRYNIPTVPHMICSGFSKVETEYALIDLHFLGIDNILVLRGDKAKHDTKYIPSENGYNHACELAQQVNDFNNGLLIDGTKTDYTYKTPFFYGVAGYPEKHEEAPNFDIDMFFLKHKVDMGADYIVTQMCFDNNKIYNFINHCRQMGINVPIIPGLKPIVNKRQIALLPKAFHVELPNELTKELEKCKTDDDVKQVGIEWCAMQAKDLIKQGIPSIHFYSHNATESVRRTAELVY